MVLGMAHIKDHCDDCELILGDRCQEVNRWIDELFRIHGPKHRRFRHHWNGVREAQRLWGDKGAKAAIIHIVRDCGDVPKNERAYDANTLGIIIAPEVFMYDDTTHTGREKFNAKVYSLFEKYFSNDF